MTPYEAQAELVALFDRIQTEVGGDGENQDDPSPMSCDVRGGGAGVQFTASRRGGSPGTMEDAKAAAAAVTALLTAEGYEIRESGLFGEQGQQYPLWRQRCGNGPRRRQRLPSRRYQPDLR